MPEREDADPYSLPTPGASKGRRLTHPFLPSAATGTGPATRLPQQPVRASFLLGLSLSNHGSHTGMAPPVRRGCPGSPQRYREGVKGCQGVSYRGESPLREGAHIGSPLPSFSMSRASLHPCSSKISMPRFPLPLAPPSPGAAHRWWGSESGLPCWAGAGRCWMLRRRRRGRSSWKQDRLMGADGGGVGCGEPWCWGGACSQWGPGEPAPGRITPAPAPAHCRRPRPFPRVGVPKAARSEGQINKALGERQREKHVLLPVWAVPGVEGVGGWAGLGRGPWRWRWAQVTDGKRQIPGESCGGGEGERRKGTPSKPAPRRPPQSRIAPPPPAGQGCRTWLRSTAPGVSTACEWTDLRRQNTEL